MTLKRPNIVYLHSHDTGRHIQPYGHQVPTPNIQRLADQGMLFRHAFSAAPVAARRGRAADRRVQPHERDAGSGAPRLPARRLRPSPRAHAAPGGLHDDDDRRAARLRRPGGDRLRPHRRDRLQPRPRTSLPPRPRSCADAPAPFFLSVGFFETHRDYFEPTSVRDALYSLPPAHLPDTPETRRDIAAYKASARSLDQGVGTVLDAIADDNTLVILTTDHGLAFPGAKATLTDRGIGVMLIVRGPGLRRRQGLRRARLADRPVPDDLRAGGDRAARMGARALAGARTPPSNDAVFAEITFHAAYEPQRAVRTKRYKYIRRFDNGHAGPVLANIDDSPSKDLPARPRAGRARPGRGGALRPRVRSRRGEQPRGRPGARIGARRVARAPARVDAGHRRPAARRAGRAAARRRAQPARPALARTIPTVVHR